MNILMKAEEKKQQKASTSLVDFAKEMALLTSKAIFGNKRNIRNQAQNTPIILEEKDDDFKSIKSSILPKRNIEKSSTFPSQLTHISLGSSEGNTIKKETNSPFTKNQKGYLQTDSDDYLRMGGADNKTNTLQFKDLSDEDSSDESKSYQESLIDEDTEFKSDQSSKGNATKGKLSLYEKSMRRMNFIKAKREEQKNQKMMHMTDQLQTIPLITEKSRRMVEKMSDYRPLYLRAGNIHFQKKFKIQIEENKRRHNQEACLKENEDYYKRKQRLKVMPLTKEDNDFLMRQDKWINYVDHKKMGMKAQNEHSKIKGSFNPQINKRSKEIIQKLIKSRNVNEKGNETYTQQLECVYNRLHLDKEHHNARQQFRNAEAKPSFKPTVSHYPSPITRTQRIEPVTKVITTNSSIGPNQMQKSSQPKQQSISLTRSKQTTHNNCIKSRNIYVANSEVDEEYVLPTYKSALNQKETAKLKSHKLSSCRTNHSTNLSAYNQGLSQTRDGNSKLKSKRSMNRSSSTMTTCLGIPDMFKVQNDIAEKSNVNKEIGLYNCNEKSQTVKHLTKK